MVCLYELDLPTLSLKQEKGWRVPASSTGFALYPLPQEEGGGGGGGGGEGAFLVLSENWVGLKHRTTSSSSSSSSSSYREIRAPFPRPKGLPPTQGILPICLGGGGWVGGWFTLWVQSEWGDVYEVGVKPTTHPPTLSVTAVGGWVPPCRTLVGLRKGGAQLLYAGGETGVRGWVGGWVVEKVEEIKAV